MQEPGFGAPIPPPTGDVYSPVGSTSGINDSGTGPTAQLPAELQGFNVGALLMSWVWAIAHQTWIGLLSLVPCVGIVMAIILGIKGNEYAWQNRKWDSIEQFKATQKVWMYWESACWYSASWFRLSRL
jgi:hypothetical protein